MSRNRVRIHQGDTVVVTAGADKGKIGRVIDIDTDKRRVKVEGVRVVKKHQKPAGEQAGGILFQEAYTDVSNVAYWDSATSTRVKIGYSIVDGKKVRVNRATGAKLNAG